MSPITELIKKRPKNQAIEWNEQALHLYKNVKEALISASILGSPDFSKLFTIQCDISDSGIGCVLTQHQGDDERVMVFAGRSLNKAECNYSVTENECLGVVFATDKIRSSVDGAYFKIITDHYSLLW